MTWLPPVLPKSNGRGSVLEPGAVTAEEYERILNREKNVERCAFCDLCWHLGGSQSGIANLKAADINGQAKLHFFRAMTGVTQVHHLGQAVEQVLNTFPQLQAKDRAARFQMVCRRLVISGNWSRVDPNS